MQSAFKKGGEQLTRAQMSEEQKEEVNLYARWKHSGEYKILKKYAGQPIENVPEEYREKIETLRKYGIEPKPEQEKTTYELVIEFLKNYGRIMQVSFYEKGEDGKSKKLTIEQMTEEQRQESRLYHNWYNSDEYKILQEYAGQPIDRVPEEYREKIATLRQYGLEPKPEQEKTTYELVIEFIKNHGRIMKGSFYGKGENGKRKQLTTDKMTEEQNQEVNLYARWRKSDECKILQEYAGQPIESVPEEYREKIETLREYVLESEKTVYELVIEFLKNHGRIMQSAFNKDGKRLTSAQMTEEQREEANLYARWRKSDEYKILQEYAGQPIERVPEEYREKIATLRNYGIEPRPKRTRTSKEIAEASISSLTNIEMSDREDAALRELVERTKEGGMNIDEQS